MLVLIFKFWDQYLYWNVKSLCFACQFLRIFQGHFDHDFTVASFHLFFWCFHIIPTRKGDDGRNKTVLSEPHRTGGLTRKNRNRSPVRFGSVIRSFMQCYQNWTGHRTAKASVQRFTGRIGGSIGSITSFLKYI